jgi:hypothetical protein
VSIIVLPANDAKVGWNFHALHALADEMWDTTLAVTPTLGTFLGLPGAHHDRLDDNSLETVRRLERHAHLLLHAGRFTRLAAHCTDVRDQCQSGMR